MQPPTTSYPYGYSGNQHGSSTSVKSHFSLLIPGWVVKTCHCTRHTEHYSTTDPLEVEYDEYRTLKFSGLGLIHLPSTHLDPSSTRPRPITGQTRKQGSHDIGPGVFSPSHPLRHHGVQGWLAILETCRYSDLYNTRQNFTSKAPPASLPPLDPIKGQVGDSTKGGGRRTTKSQSPSYRRRSTSQAISFVLSLFLSETWDRLPLS
jgi:hypothetical protein